MTATFNVYREAGTARHPGQHFGGLFGSAPATPSWGGPPAANFGSSAAAHFGSGAAGLGFAPASYGSRAAMGHSVRTPFVAPASLPMPNYNCQPGVPRRVTFDPLCAPYSASVLPRRCPPCYPGPIFVDAGYGGGYGAPTVLAAGGYSAPAIVGTGYGATTSFLVALGVALIIVGLCLIPILHPGFVALICLLGLCALLAAAA